MLDVARDEMWTYRNGISSSFSDCGSAVLSVGLTAFKRRGCYTLWHISLLPLIRPANTWTMARDLVRDFSLFIVSMGETLLRRIVLSITSPHCTQRSPQNLYPVPSSPISMQCSSTSKPPQRRHPTDPGAEPVTWPGAGVSSMSRVP